MTTTTGPTKTHAAATITLASAGEIIQAARDAATEIGIEVAVAVTDAGGHLTAFARTDDARFLTVQVAIDKAWTAVSYGVHTHTWAGILADPAVSQMANIPRMLAAGGGYPIVLDGAVVGGLGISGGTHEQDEQAAETALQAAGFQV